ncbi:MAG: radical SAM-associated putative lipoprotein [Paludibacteraceae bacterium]|nr:radical SAM-associated putative lipoprotein [Paludibacteraceae bacterium]
MKVKVLTWYNAVLAFLLGLLGFSSCDTAKKYGPGPDIAAEYGCPYATLEVSGTVSDKGNTPLENIQVAIKGKYDLEEADLKEYTDQDGKYIVGADYIFPIDSVDILVKDNAGVYAPDSVRVKVDYDQSNVQPEDHWNNGAGTAHHDFLLEKK